MSSTPSYLESYNSILDPSLSTYFDNNKKKQHLRKIGLLDKNYNIRSEPEIEEYNNRITQKKSTNDLISRAIVMRAAELDRQRDFEYKKQLLEDEKRKSVDKIKSKRNRPVFTKKLGASFIP